MKSFLRDQSGQTVVVAALCMMVILCFLGLAVDVGHLRLVKRQLQGAADSAALAAGLELRICGSVANCPAMQAAAQNAMVENGLTGSKLIVNCGGTPGAGLTLMVNSPSCFVGSADPNATSKRYVEVVVSEQVRTYFARVVGYDNVPISARAEAKRNPGKACIYALDPAADGALNLLAGLASNTACGIIVESSSPKAATCLVGLNINVPRIAITGGKAGLLCQVTPQPATGVARPVPADPLAYLPKPAVGACGTSTASPYSGSSKAVSITLGGNYILNPGVYCGGISITSAILNHVTFNPGMYILKPGPGVLLGTTTGGLSMTLGLLSNISGTGVTFYNVGPQGSYSVTAPTTLQLSNFALSAPTTGTYGGMLFMQDPANTSSATFLASLASGSKLEGAIYIPNAAVNYGVGAISSAYTILVAKTVTFTASILSTFGSNYSPVDIGSPLNGDAAVLTQ